MALNQQVVAGETQLNRERPSEDSRSIGELLGDLLHEATTLMRQEINLAKIEFTQNLKRMGRDAAMVAAGGAVAYAGLLVILAAIVLALIHNGMSPVGSSFLVGIIVLAIGGGLIMKAIGDMKRASIAPVQTVESVKEDVQWVKNQTR